MAAMDATTQYLILGLVVSILANLVILGGVFVTGVGQRVLLRYRQRWQYKKGRHVNIIFVRNNHTAREIFVKKESDGSFKIEDKRYIVNPYCTFIHDGIPTQVNLEGTTEPYNIFSSDMAQAMSTAEIDKIIMNNEVHDLAAALRKYFIPFCILVGALVLFMLYNGYSLHKVEDWIVNKDIIGTTVEWARSQNITGYVEAR